MHDAIKACTDGKGKMKAGLTCRKWTWLGSVAATRMRLHSRYQGPTRSPLVSGERWLRALYVLKAPVVALAARKSEAAQKGGK